MVEHETGKDPIEGRIGIGQRIRESPIELNGHGRGVSLALRAYERLHVRVETGDVDGWLCLRDQHQQGARSAADLEYPLAWLEVRLLDEHASGGVTTEELYERVI